MIANRAKDVPKGGSLAVTTLRRGPHWQKKTEPVRMTTTAPAPFFAYFFLAQQKK
jgi:hypothetical protein